ncbi:MAG: DNA repair protein [Burkholderiaceae bacterium]|nr:MAG: DNA repair protein [Burkholderiaceae bacterium]
MGSPSQLTLFTEEIVTSLICSDSEERIYPGLGVTDTDGERCIQQALSVLEKRLKKARPVMSNPTALKDYLRLQIGGLDYEMFGIVWTDSQLNLIGFNKMFRGTINQTSVYPREVVREAMICNASACIFVHNHPSGSCQPSTADESLTQQLRSALALVDVRVLDHVIVSRTGTLSMAEKGLL